MFIKQLQFSEFKNKQGILSKILMLNFNNLVSELFFVARRASNSCDFIDIENIELNFNNTSVFNRDNKFLCYKQSLDNHIRSPSGKDLDGGGKYCSYSFSLNPISGLPMGSVNMSRIIHKLLKIAIPTNINEDVIVRVYAVSHNILMFSHGLAGLKF
jgi:Large eukaryotic DNA virus major capsid protein.